MAETNLAEIGIWVARRRVMRCVWRLGLFWVLLYIFKRCLGAWINAIPSLQIQLLSMVSGTVTLSGIFILEIRNLASAALAVLVMRRFGRRSLSRYGFNPADAFRIRFWKGIALGLVSALLLFSLLRAERVFSFGHLLLSGRSILVYASCWFFSCVLVGLYEEFVFRGYLLHTLMSGVGFWPAAWISSILFGVIHLGNGRDPWFIALSATAFGMCYSISVRETGSVWFAVGVHAAFDFFETFLVSPNGGLNVQGHLLDSQLHGPVWLTGGVAGPEASVNGVLLFALLFLIVNRRGGLGYLPEH